MLDYYEINICDSSNVIDTKITINGNIKEKMEINDTNIKLSINVHYYYKNTDGLVAEILYLNKIVELDEENMNYSLTLSPKNAISNFESFYGFDITYEVIEVSGNV